MFAPTTLLSKLSSQDLLESKSPARQHHKPDQCESEAETTPLCERTRVKESEDTLCSYNGLSTCLYDCASVARMVFLILFDLIIHRQASIIVARPVLGYRVSVVQNPKWVVPRLLF